MRTHMFLTGNIKGFWVGQAIQKLVKMAKYTSFGDTFRYPFIKVKNEYNFW